MPQTKSAKRASRVIRRRTAINFLVKKQVKAMVSQMRKKPSKENLQKTASLLDRAVKKGVIHQNRAARLKKRLNWLLTKSGKNSYTKTTKQTIKHAQKQNQPATSRRLRKKAAR